MEAVLYGNIEVDAHEGSFVFYTERNNEEAGVFRHWDDLSMIEQVQVIELRGEAVRAVSRLGDYLKGLQEQELLAA